MRHILEQALRAFEVPRPGQRREEGVPRGGVAERRGRFVEQLVSAGQGGREAGVEGEDGVADKGVGGEEARLGGERLKLLAAVKARGALEGCDQERGQRRAAAGHVRSLPFTALWLASNEGA
jgi:hypothetical protein